MKRLVLASLLVGCGETPSIESTAHSIAHDDEGISHAIPIFNVGSLRESQRYYREKLGFTVEWDHGDPPDFGAVVRDHAVLFLCQGCQGHPGGWIMMFTPNVDELHRELVERGAIIERPPTNMPWHLREMLVKDPDGNTMRFASRIEH